MNMREDWLCIFPAKQAYNQIFGKIVNKFCLVMFLGKKPASLSQVAGENRKC
jgi:hypothetical protein